MPDFNFGRHIYDFPQQKVPASTKRKADWYAQCIDFVIDAGLANTDMTRYEDKINILHGNIPDEFYRKTLNPYNSKEERFTHFPATMRNFDIMSDIIRRYIGEYTKGNHDFTVGSNDPNLVINKSLRLKQEVSQLCQKAFVAEFNKRLQQMQEELAQNGELQNNQQQISPEQVMSEEEIEAFVKDFNEKYIDEKSELGQQLLEFIQSTTEDESLYAEAYFNFVSFGRFFTYSKAVEGKIIKENVPITEAYPIPTRQARIEDHDMFARRMKMSKHQILDMFEDYLSKEDKHFFDTYYAQEGPTGQPQLLRYDQYFEHYPDTCNKFTSEERRLFKESPQQVYDSNGGLYDVWHVVWKGYKRQGILTYVGQTGMVEQMIVDEEDFTFDAALGHLDIEWIYTPEVYEGYRIGNRYTAIYPIKARPVGATRPDKLPYNGLLEPLPLMGEFSIVDVVTPFQIMRNIFVYHREMVIAKNKLLVLIIPESLLGDSDIDQEDRIYKIAADGVFTYDDSMDTGSVKAQQIRMLNANLNDYIRQMTDLINSIKEEAREEVDMTSQRYGEIATSAGKATTEEAIARGSMGSVSINFVFDKCRCADYQKDIDNAKIAFVDGLESGYWDAEGNRANISMNSEQILFEDYSVMVKNSAKENEKLEQLRQWAFSAAQNGDLDQALAAITGNNIASMKKSIMQFMELKRQHEDDLKQADLMIEQSKLENKLKEIAAKGEEDRKLEQLKYYYEMQMKYIDADIAILDDNGAGQEQYKSDANERIEQGRREIEREKLNIERLKVASDNFNAAADRNVQREQMQNDLKIARTNKNKYDK